MAMLQQQFPHPKDQLAIRQFFTVMYGIYHQVHAFTKLKPWQRWCLFPFIPLIYPYLATYANPKLSFLAKTNPLMWMFRPAFLFKKFHTLGTLLDSLSNNENLKKLLCANLGYYHDDPYSMSLSFFAAAQTSYFEGGGWFIKGGSQQLSNYLASIILRHGGTLRLGRNVTDIMVDGNRITGITYQNTHDREAEKENIQADVLVANAAPANIVDMLPSSYASKLRDKVVTPYQDACSLLSIYVGFKSNLAHGIHKGGAYSTFVTGKNPAMSLRSCWQGIKNQHPGDRDFVFVDYSHIDSGLSSDEKTVGVLCSIGYLNEWNTLSESQYKTQKEEVAKRMFNALEKVIPGILEDIEYYDVGTPQTIQAYTRNPSGSPYGFAQTPAQTGLLRMYDVPGLKNLYFASAWSFPGGGFTGAFLAAQEVTRKLLRRYTPDPELKKITVSEHDACTCSTLLASKEIATHTIELTFSKNRFFERFKVGQYAVLSLDQPRYQTLDMPWRPLSITSHPDEPVLRFAMRTSASAFKQSCLAMQIGDSVKIYGPMGDFVLGKQTRHLVFLVSGIGITPIMPMLQELEKNRCEQAIYLFYSNRTQSETAYHDHIDQLQLPGLHAIHHHTATEPRIDGELLAQHIPHFMAYDYYVVGASDFIRDMLNILDAKHVPSAHIHVDDFG